MRSAALLDHFENLEQQHEADALGMWVFLATEVLFFGGLFLAYSVFRARYVMGFALGSNELNATLGTINTAVLLCSSFTMALAVRAAQIGRRLPLALLLLGTAALGALFLGIKAHEWFEGARHHHFPGPGFFFPEAGPHARGVELFMWLYYGMTALHALHLTIGICLLLGIAVQAARGRYSAAHHPAVESAGLYWHFVDIVWIFLYPLLYLAGRHI
jgi:cytochrome c oxidase subunit 3